MELIGDPAVQGAAGVDFETEDGDDTDLTAGDALGCAADVARFVGDGRTAGLRFDAGEEVAVFECASGAGTVVAFCWFLSPAALTAFGPPLRFTSDDEPAV